MKIFISHASANKEFGNALVDLLRSVIVGEQEIIFTSNTVYGIPNGKNIFDWLKVQITDKPFVVYLLSNQYYASIACLNEMGAAWVIENQHAILLTPTFDVDSKQFRSGAIDPREIAFRLNDEERMLAFIHDLKLNFNITTNPLLINQILKKYLREVNAIINFDEVQNAKVLNTLDFNMTDDVSVSSMAQNKAAPMPDKNLPTDSIGGVYEKFVNSIVAGKLKDEELILLHYSIERGKTKLMTGWQEDNEIGNIRDWEEIDELNNLLSSQYSSVLRKFDVRGFTEVSAFTSSNNPKEVKLRHEIEVNILDLPNEVLLAIKEALQRNKLMTKDEDEDLPF